jgi:hypothetical protein
MADQNKARQIEDKIRQKLAQLGQALDEWLNKQRLQPQPIPVPLDRRYRKKNNNH